MTIHWKVPAQNERRPKFTGTMDRSMPLKENVSFCNNSAGVKMAEGFGWPDFCWVCGDEGGARSGSQSLRSGHDPGGRSRDSIRF
jgi:hypothetical protein